jgi:hypothetical protein
LNFLRESPIIIESRAKYSAKLEKEVTWRISKVVAVDSAELRERCTRRFVQNARKNAKSLLNPEMTVRYTAGIAIPSVRTKAVNERSSFLG